MSRTVRGFGFWLPLLLILSCISPQERFQNARQLELEGQPAEAAAQYVRVLEAEPGFEEARVELRRVGAQAIDDFLVQARRAESARDYDAAVRSYDEAIQLAGRAQRVGETIAPGDLGGRRNRARRSAFEAYVTSASAYQQAGEWEKALEVLTSAPERYADTIEPLDESRLQSLRAGIHLRWSEEELARGSNRAAHTRAQQVIDLVGAGSRTGRRALAIQQKALYAGTRRVIWLPLTTTEAWAATAPEEIAKDLDDVLTYQRWSNPPSFVQPAADPRGVRRKIRELGYGDEPISRQRAAVLGTAFGAHYVVLTEASEFTREGGTLEATVSYRIIDAESRQPVLDERIVESVSADPADVAAGPAGSVGEVMLDPATERELEGELLDLLADGLSEKVFDALLELVE